ncbi:MAG: hypothetical protein PF638_12425, partial [Candidatus Delongbacteria bacterium]|nr:hypothetical protein [Candidatus Delongbacteria bacterium]
QNIHDQEILKNEIIKYTNYMKLFRAIFFLSIIVSLVLLFNLGLIYLAIVILTLIPFVYFYSKNSTLITLGRIKNLWGKELIRKRHFKKIKERYLLAESNVDYKYVVDDQTWYDLNFDDIFAKIDITFTTPGEIYLYKILRNPLFDIKSIELRKKFIELFENDVPLREKVQFYLSHLDKDNSYDITKILWGNYSYTKSLKNVLNMFSIIAFLSVLSPFYFGEQATLFIVFPIFLVNLLIYLYASKRYPFKPTSILYLKSLLGTAVSISSIKETGIEKFQDRIKIIAPKYKKIIKRNLYIIYHGEGILNLALKFINIFFLLESKKFYTTVYEMHENTNYLKEIYNLIGKMDALQSIASYRKSLANYTTPVFDENAVYIKATNIVHPLVANPVPNSIKIMGKGILITGANMSGKTTFLRTLGINTILSQTIITCLGTSYKGNLFKVISSISKSDNLSKGKSFYYAEAERLLKIVKSSESDINTLCLIDELLSGTNSIERVSASEEILKYIIRKNSLVVVATHDLEITSELGEFYSCYHFNDSINKNDLNFDYQIKEGIAETTNAIKILNFLKYPQSIINNSNRKITTKIRPQL